MHTDRKPRIFVVDDEKMITRAFWRGLHYTCEVIQETDGKAAQEVLISSEEFDVIFLDIVLNGITGIDLYQFCEREAPRRCHRIVFISADPYLPDAAAFLIAVNARVLAKPFGLEAVEREVERLKNDPSPRGP